MTSGEPDAMAGRRFLVVGCGSIGTRHIGNLRKIGVQDIIAVDPREDRRLESARRFGIPVFADLDTALRQAVYAALICSPTRLHSSQALDAAKAGCHLFIEKPLSDSLEGIDELLDEIQRRHLMTLVGCNFRFHPGLRKVKALLHEGAVGRVVSGRAQFGQYLPDWHPWEDYRHGYSAQRALGGGVALDRIHEIDCMRWLLGDVTQVFAMMGHLSGLEIDTEDTAEILLRFASGALGSIHLDYVRRTYDCRLEIVGDCGTLQWCYQDHSVAWYLATDKQWRSLRWPGYDPNAAYLDEIEHFLKVLRGEEESEQDCRSARIPLEIVLAAKSRAADPSAGGFVRVLSRDAGH
ncbi:MAG: Gfo/Idh/MocA family oxidoreductase [Chloroflexi bacterium]|nr:Gfo/Idh/MocA family oxidoreductase [Chloroflexota bacterium]